MHHPAFRSLRLRAGHQGLQAHRFCMPATGAAGTTPGGWYNGGNGRLMVGVVVAAHRNTDPGAPFRGLLPLQEVEIEVTGPGGAGDWVIVAADGRATPIPDGEPGQAGLGGILLEDAGADGEVVRLLFWPGSYGAMGVEGVLEG